MQIYNQLFDCSRFFSWTQQKALVTPVSPLTSQVEQPKFIIKGSQETVLRRSGGDVIPFSIPFLFILHS